MRELLCYSVTLSCSCYHGYSLPVYLWLQTCAVHTVKRVAYVLHQKHCPINSKTNVDSGSIRHYQLSASFSHHIILTVLYFTFFYDLFTKLNPNIFVQIRTRTPHWQRMHSRIFQQGSLAAFKLLTVGGKAPWYMVTHLRLEQVNSSKSNEREESSR